MSSKKPDEVLLPDASIYFSREEWTLLHEWQKDLYRSVMKEIHQALMSLGDKTTNLNELLRISREDNLHLDNPPATEEKERNNCLSAGIPLPDRDTGLMKEEEPVSLFIDHFGVEVRESCDSASNGPVPGQDIISFRIKDEGAAYCMDHLDSARTECFSRPTGEGLMLDGKNVGRATPCTKTAAPFKASSAGRNTRMLQSSGKETNSGCQLEPEGFQALGGQKTTSCNKAFSNTEHFNLHLGRAKERLSQKNTKNRSKLLKFPSNNSHPGTEQVQTPYTCTECGKSYRLKGELIKHMGYHSGVMPYACSDCGKTFYWKANFITHQRTHTGDRPYSCTFCPKRFGRADNLKGHIRIHTGERPYQCTQCEKEFTWKSDLRKHLRRKH
ncbi:zinc finger protein 154-like isoform X2 [Ambystoma mexicanum]|uniref:zinc finger protein 154-like isoform X2 n=1 Tax=Ambystoma mexicanum TaxID=8296 RepID=UPI0037E7B9FE